MDFEKYRAHPAIGNSDLKLINRSIEHYEYSKANPKPQTAATKFGTDFHCYVLEPEKFDATYVKLPDEIKPGTSNAYKDFKAMCERDKKLIVGKDDLEAFKIMKERVMAQNLLVGGQSEVSLFGKITAAETKIDIKCRPDYLTNHIVFDLKTTVSAERDEFDHSIRKYRYFVQGALYIEIARQNNPLVEKFVFIAIESEPPYGIACYELSPEYIEAGKIQYTKDLEKYIYDTRTKRKGYETGVNIIHPPEWFMRQYFPKG